MFKVLRAVFRFRAEHKDDWYRLVFVVLLSGYVFLDMAGVDMDRLKRSVGKATPLVAGVIGLIINAPDLTYKREKSDE